MIRQVTIKEPTPIQCQSDTHRLKINLLDEHRKRFMSNPGGKAVTIKITLFPNSHSSQPDNHVMYFILNNTSTMSFR